MLFTPNSRFPAFRCRSGVTDLAIVSRGDMPALLVSDRDPSLQATRLGFSSCSLGSTTVRSRRMAEVRSDSKPLISPRGDNAQTDGLTAQPGRGWGCQWPGRVRNNHARCAI